MFMPTFGSFSSLPRCCRTARTLPIRICECIYVEPSVERALGSADESDRFIGHIFFKSSFRPSRPSPLLKDMSRPNKTVEVGMAKTILRDRWTMMSLRVWARRQRKSEDGWKKKEGDECARSAWASR